MEHNKYIEGVEQYTDGDSKLIYDKKIGRLTAICKNYEITVSIKENDGDGYCYDTDYDTTISFEYYEPIEEALARLNTESPDALTNKKCREQLYEIYANEEWKRNYSRG